MGRDGSAACRIDGGFGTAARAIESWHCTHRRSSRIRTPWWAVSKLDAMWQARFRRQVFSDVVADEVECTDRAGASPAWHGGATAAAATTGTAKVPSLSRFAPELFLLFPRSTPAMHDGVVCQPQDVFGVCQCFLASICAAITASESQRFTGEAFILAPSLQQRTAQQSTVLIAQTCYGIKKRHNSSRSSLSSNKRKPPSSPAGLWLRAPNHLQVNDGVWLGLLEPLFEGVAVEF
jgi:hypothetical protein